MDGKRVDVRFGSFACSLQGFDDPAEPLAALLRLVQERMAEPELANGRPLFDATTLQRLEAEIGAPGTDAALAATPGVVLTLRPAADRGIAADEAPAEEASPAMTGAAFDTLAERLDPGADVLGAAGAGEEQPESAAIDDVGETAVPAQPADLAEPAETGPGAPDLAPADAEATEPAAAAADEAADAAGHAAPADDAAEPAQTEPDAERTAAIAATTEDAGPTAPDAGADAAEPAPEEAQAEGMAADDRQAEAPAEQEPQRPVVNIFDDPDEVAAEATADTAEPAFTAREPDEPDDPFAEPDEAAAEPPTPPLAEQQPAAQVVNIFGEPGDEVEDEAAEDAPEEPLPHGHLGAEPPEPGEAEEPEQLDTPDDPADSREVTNIFADPDGDDGAGPDDNNVTPLKGQVREFRQFLREREKAAPEDEPLREVSLTEVVKSAGAEEVPDLLAASAAWLDLARGQSSFTRKEVIAVFDGLSGEHSKSLEAKIKGFGRLVRNGQFVTAGSDRFRLSDAERTRFSRLID